jgi:hypothetical protein
MQVLQFARPLGKAFINRRALHRAVPRLGLSGRREGRARSHGAIRSAAPVMEQPRMIWLSVTRGPIRSGVGSLSAKPVCGAMLTSSV